MPALGDLFAPAYTKSDPGSVQEVQAWMDKNRAMTNPMVEQTRAPSTFATGSQAGAVDPEALRALAQGGPYDINARRASVAAAVQAQQAQQAQQAAQARNPFGMVNSPFGQLFGSRDPNSPLLGLMGGDGSSFF